ncbi:unnamed protein product [marine sediment metagenome]|uniref:Uncharacterized protein n=1 Tax=marine sediment metagenome TaxID=412755 RepID=X1G0R7_9ZZZZ
MNNKNEIVEQSNLAFNFVEKLYLESSYLIKEIAGILNEEEEKFVIGKPSGYGISTTSSRGLEVNNVRLWLLKKFSVFFIPEEKTALRGGGTITKIDKDLKILYLRIVLNDKNIKEPVVCFGVLYNIEKKSKTKWFSKFEQAMSNLEYNDYKVFKDIKKIDYENIYIKVQGELIKNSLFEITDSESIVKKIINPSLKLFRKH